MRVRSMVPGWSTQTRLAGQSCMFIGTSKPSGTVMYRGSCWGDGGVLAAAPASHLLEAFEGTLVSQKKPLV